MREIQPRQNRPAAVAPVPMPQAAPQPQQPPQHNVAVLLAVQGAFRAIALVLSVRLLLLLSLIGAFVLGYNAMQSQTWLGLAVLTAYSALTIIPLVALAWPNRPQSE